MGTAPSFVRRWRKAFYFLSAANKTQFIFPIKVKSSCIKELYFFVLNLHLIQKDTIVGIY
jgi:hypothetical protein